MDIAASAVIQGPTLEEDSRSVIIILKFVIILSLPVCRVNKSDGTMKREPSTWNLS